MTAKGRSIFDKQRRLAFVCELLDAGRPIDTAAALEARRRGLYAPRTLPCDIRTGLIGYAARMIAAQTGRPLREVRMALRRNPDAHHQGAKEHKGPRSNALVNLRAPSCLGGDPERSEAPA